MGYVTTASPSKFVLPPMHSIAPSDQMTQEPLAFRPRLLMYGAFVTSTKPTFKKMLFTRQAGIIEAFA